jgi:oxygen-dependent protoporphyrinogen oxidase
VAEVIVVGAGISGLSTAWFLRERGHQVRVLERADRVGGTIHSFHDSGFLVDAGPNSTLDKGEALGAVLSVLGLEGEILEANPAAKRRYVAKNGRPVAMPGGLGAFLKTPLFSLGGKLRLMLEPLAGRAEREESIAEFVRRRLGQEFLDWAIDPFVSGVYAGDPERLSVRAATAKIYALEAEHGSLFLGALKRLVKGRPTGPAPRGRLISFRQGMQALPLRLAEALGGAVSTGVDVTGIAWDEGGGWAVEAGGVAHRAEVLVICVPAYVAADLLRTLHEEAAHALASIPYAAVASVALGFRRADVEHPLDGFGMLIPRRLGIETLGALFSSTLFPGRAPEGQVLLSSFIGGALNPGAVERDEASLIGRVVQDLDALLGLKGEPTFRRVIRWPRAIPQYNLGHLEKLRQIEQALERLPGLYLRANWRDGVAVGDCVANALALAERIGRASAP